SGAGRWSLRPHQVQFASIQQFPLDGFACLQSNGGGQGQWKADIEAGLLALRTHRLDLQRVSRLHFFDLRSCFHEARLYSSSMPSVIIPFDLPLPKVLPTIEGNVDYRTLRDQLLQINHMLVLGGLEDQFLQADLEGWRKDQKQVSPKTQQSRQFHSRR